MTESMTAYGKKLRIVYLAALSCIAIASTGSHFLLGTLENAIVNDTPIVNIAGRQRMLSQRLASLSQRLYTELAIVDSAAVAGTAAQLRSTVGQWRTAHEGLRVRNGVYGLRGTNSPEVEAALSSLERQINATVPIVNNLIDMSNDRIRFDATSAADAVATIIRNTERFLLEMDAVVDQLQLEATQRVNRLRTFEYSATVFVIVLLIGLAVFAFEPAIRTLSRQAKDLLALRSALDTHTSFSVTDRHGRILDVNEGFRESSGYSREELIGATHALINSGHHPKSFWADMWHTISSGKAWRGEVCNRAKDGSLYWIDATNIPQFDEYGEIERFISLRFDISEKKRAEAARNAALNQLESVLNAASQFAIISCDTEGAIETFNSGAARMLGYSVEEIVGQHLTKFLLESEVIAYAKELSQELGKRISPHEAMSWYSSGGGYDEGVWTYVCKDGTHLTCRTTVTGIFDSDGKLTGFVGITADITEKLATERQLEEQRGALRAIIDAIPSFVWYKSKDQIILDCNTAAASSLGLEREHILGKRTHDILPAENAERHAEADTLTLARGESELGFIETLEDAQGRERYLRMDKTPLRNAAGEFDRIVVVATDISDMVYANYQLREVEERLDLALAASNTGLWDWNVLTGETYFNDVVLRLLGYEPGELEMSIVTWKELCHPDDRTRAAAALDDHIAGKCKTYQCEYRIRRKGGEYRWVRDVGKIVEYDKDGVPNRIVGVYIDIQALRDALDDVERSNERLQETQQRFEHAIEGSRDAIFDWDVGSGKVYFSSRWLELLNIDADSLGSTIPDLLWHVAPGDAERVQRELNTFVSSLDDRFESEFQLVDGRDAIVWVMMRAFASRDAAGAAVRVAGSVADITALKTTQEAMQRLVQQDHLTGLASRVRLTERLEHAVTRSKRNENYCGVLFFDFDRFKVVNDSLGHDVGDELLCSIAERLRSNLREADTPARIGGDEFVVLLEDLKEPGDVRVVADKLLDVCAEPHQIRGHSLVSTASIGLVTSEHAVSSGLELLGYADAAMYEAKRRGRACVVEFDQQMFDAQQQRAELEEELLNALDDDQLTLNYQPVVDLETGAIVAAEALLRWIHPTKGNIPPGRFILIAEESRQIIRIGEWVIREACRQLVAWRSQGVVSDEFAISINASKVQLLTPGFEEMLIRHIDSHGLPRTVLKIEVTETTVVDNRSDISEVLNSLREQSIVIMMDDFGTGHSSLSVLHNLPIDELKIDQSFIRHADSNRELVAITSSIVTLAEHLSLKTIGEGVESPDHIALLQTLGCNYGQGYYWSKPLPADELGKLISGHVTDAAVGSH